MVADTRSRPDSTPESESRDAPDIAVCKSAPDTSVFLESGNTDGWIASDLTVDIPR
jgi:hypothetical protein